MSTSLAAGRDSDHHQPADREHLRVPLRGIRRERRSEGLMKGLPLHEIFGTSS